MTDARDDDADLGVVDASGAGTDGVVDDGSDRDASRVGPSGGAAPDGGAAADEAASAPRRWRDDVRMLREHDLGLLVASRLVSDFGNGVAPIALAFGVLALPGGDASSLGLVLLGAALPRIVFMLFGGVLADRVRSRSRLMATTEIVAAAAQLVAAALFLSGHATVPALAALAALNGTAVAIFYPTMTGLMPQVASGAALQSANALVRLSSNIAGILGTAIGGILVATVGAGWALLIDAATYALSALLLWLVRATSAPVPEDERQSVLDDLTHGWREFTARRWVWLIVVLFGISNFGFTASIDVLGPVRALESWDGPRGWAVVLVTFSVGTVLGVVVAMRIRPSRPLLVASAAQLFVALPVIALAPPAPLAVVAVLGFVSGVCIDVFEVLWQTTLQQQIPAESLSRVASYDWFGSLSLTPLALIAAGALESWLGLQGALWVCGILGAAAGLAILDPAVRGVRAVPTST